MNKGLYTILSNGRLTQGAAPEAKGSLWKMRLGGDSACISAPGQFIQIALPKRYLRRPISICDWNADSITIVYRVVGAGTEDLSAMCPGESLDLIAGLGNGFSTEGCLRPLLVGGGVGLPPMLGLSRTFLEKGIIPSVVAGFNTAAEAILLEDFRSLGIEPLVATMDGSLGVKGTVIDAIGACAQAQGADKFFACGPKPMLRALSDLPIPGEMSMEERMGCGFGVCMGCSIKTRSGMKRVCAEGPVFDKEDLIW